MPFRWDPPDGPGAPARLTLWPHRSLTPAGFVGFFAITFALVSVPILSMLGSPALWGILPFVGVCLGGLWVALRRNSRDAAIVEVLSLWPDRIHLIRRGPRDQVAEWEANPHWVQVRLHPGAGPVRHYVTLRGNGREVEIGAFLSEAERLSLRDELASALAKAR